MQIIKEQIKKEEVKNSLPLYTIPYVVKIGSRTVYKTIGVKAKSQKQAVQKVKANQWAMLRTILN